MSTHLSTLLRQCGVALGALLIFTALLGVAYPAVVWAGSRLTSHSAEGSAINDSAGCPVGSSLIGIDAQPNPGQPDSYLHSRVVRSDDNPLAPGDPSASGGSNLGPNSTALAELITQRRELIARREGVNPNQVPTDAVTASGSGLDPDISPAYAQLQVPRIARNSGRSESEIRSIIAAHTQGRQWGFLGQERVNVLEVNVALGHRVCH